MRWARGSLRVALVFAALLAALSGVVWRQSRALETLRSLDALRQERALVEAEKTELVRRIQLLESRARVVRAARQRLGLHVPSSDEIVILPLTSDAALTPIASGIAAGAGAEQGSGRGGEAELGGAGARHVTTRGGET
ncbi:MAG: cell division protein FtsL [Longimicrobiales bacterium]